MPAPGEDAAFEVRSVALSSAQLGLSARIDLVEGEGGAVSPVDYKRGKSPPNGLDAHEPERVQLSAYGLLLREHGYTCERGYCISPRRRHVSSRRGAIPERS